MAFKTPRTMRYAGGKLHLINDIKRLIPFPLANRTVIDVFGGSAKFLLSVESYNKVYNDLDRRIVNLWNVIREDPAALAKRHDFSLKSRVLFDEYRKSDTTGDRVEDAYRKLYVMYHSFAGRSGHAATYGYSIEDEGDKSVSAIDTFIRELRPLNREVRTWNIECMDFRKLIKTYDSATAFFYLDPPYYDVKRFYDLELQEQDFRDLAAILGEVKGKYVMNIDDTPEVRRIFGEPTAALEYANNNSNRRTSATTTRIELFYANTMRQMPKLESFEGAPPGADIRAFT